jgi:hypothetical protein
VVRERQVVFQATGTAGLRRDRRQIVKNKVHSIPPSVHSPLIGAANGDVESNARLAVDALNLRNLPALVPGLF